LVTGSAALAYRWYFRAEIPEGVAALLGVAVVALYLNTTSLGSVAAGDNPTLLAPESVFFNLVSLGVAVVIAPIGRYMGDRLSVDVFALSGARQLEGELSGMVRAVGRFTAVTLPETDEIRDMDTYDPVSPEKKAELSEKTLLFRGNCRSQTSASDSSPGSNRSTASATSTSTSTPTGRCSTSPSAPAPRGSGRRSRREPRRRRWPPTRRTTPPPATRYSCGETTQKSGSRPANCGESPATPSPWRSTSRMPSG